MYTKVKIGELLCGVVWSAFKYVAKRSVRLVLTFTKQFLTCRTARIPCLCLSCISGNTSLCGYHVSIDLLPQSISV